MIINFKIYEKLEYNTNDSLEYFLYHGTSSKELELIKKSNYIVKDFYLGEDIDNISLHYAETTSLRDDSESVIIELKVEMLDGVFR